MRKRAASAEATRHRIITAAMELYQTQGVSATSMQQVARQADVAPGTVLNHFPSPDDLAEAVIEHLRVELRYPAGDMFEGLQAMDQRVSRLARELADFYRRSEPWYRVSVNELDQSPAFAEAWREFYVALDKLMRTALGPLGHDEQAVSALSAILSPPVFGTLQQRGMSTEQAADFATGILLPWLNTRVETKETKPD